MSFSIFQIWPSLKLPMQDVYNSTWLFHLLSNISTNPYFFESITNKIVATTNITTLAIGSICFIAVNIYT